VSKLKPTVQIRTLQTDIMTSRSNLSQQCIL